MQMQNQTRMASGGVKIPAGLELMYDLEKGNVSNPLDAFVLSLHWSIIRTGLRQRSAVNDSEFTERLPQDWALLGATNGGGPTRTLTLTYYDPHSARVRYELKVIELTANDMVAVTFFRSPNQTSGGPNEEEAGSSSATASVTRPASNKSSGEDKNSAASTFQIPNFIRVGAFGEGQKKERATEVYEHADVLETQLYESVMEPLGLRVMGQPPVTGPYDDAASATKTNGSSSETRGSRERDPEDFSDPFSHPGLRRPFPSIPGGLGPLHVPPIGIGGGLGRSDLDPFGGIGQGSLMDPRGFRTPRIGMPGLLPGAHPAGARFDPFGPPNPARPGRGTGSFAVPNPDHERPPSSDYDDMFM